MGKISSFFYALIFFGANVVCDENLTRKKIENSV